MNKIYSLAGGLKRIDVPVNHIKNNLPIGTILQLNGYSNPKYCIIKNMGVDERWNTGAKYTVINIEDGSESIKETIGMDHISTKTDNRIKMYYTDKILSADEIMDLINKAELKKKHDITAKAAADQARALELDTLKSQYKHLERVIPYNEQVGRYRTSYAVGAANIRTELKKSFPQVKFSVTSEGYSGGCSINVRWTNAITTEEVEKIINKYEYGTFDSMTDCAGSIDSQFIDLYGGARFVTANRSVSEDGFNAVALKMGYTQAKFNNLRGNFDGVDYAVSETIKREAWITKF